MIRWLLNLAYALALAIYAPVLCYRRWFRGHRTMGWRQKLTGDLNLPKFADRPIWFHAVSVGEVNLLAPLIERCQTRWPNRPLVVSTTTATGYQVASKRYPQIPLFFWPFDFSWAVQRALREVNPQAVILAELELWPNFLASATAKNIPVVVVNGRLSDRSWRSYRRFRPIVRRMLRQVDLVCAQDSVYAQRFQDLGVPADRIQVTGNLKFDGINVRRDMPATQRLVEQYAIEPDELVWVAGSTQPDEDQCIVDVYQRLRRENVAVRLVIAPRHPEKLPPLVARLQTDAEPFVLRSQNTPAVGKPTVVVDVLGELSAWWARADVAFVGGSINPRGGQNMIEPAAVGAAVCFGPNTQNFRDTVAGLMRNQAAVVVNDRDQLYAFVRAMSLDAFERRRLGQAAQAFVLASQGALDNTWQAWQSVMSPVPRGALEK